MKKITSVLVLLLAAVFSVNAQFELGLSGIPSLSRFHVKNQDIFDDYITPLNYGIKVNYHLNRFMLSSGVMHFSQGQKFVYEKTNLNNPEGTGEYYDVYFRARSIMIPLLANFKFLESSKSTFFVGTGIYTGYIYSQEWENTAPPKEGELDPLVNNTSLDAPFTEQDQFNDFYFGFNFGMGWSQKISDHLSFQLRPNFLYQLREEQPKSTHAFTSRMMTWALDLGLYYRL